MVGGGVALGTLLVEERAASQRSDQALRDSLKNSVLVGLFSVALLIVFLCAAVAASDASGTDASGSLWYWIGPSLTIGALAFALSGGAFVIQNLTIRKSYGSIV